MLSGGGTAIGSTGGEAEHTLTVAEMPSHKHSDRIGFFDKASNLHPLGVYTEAGLRAVDAHDEVSGRIRIDSDYSVDSEGGSQAHNNMPPYLAVMAWKRIE